MGRQTTNDFVVDTKGQCFICLQDVSPQFLKTESGQRSPSIHSLQQLSRHVKLKMRKVFQQEDLIPEYLLEKVETSTLKVTLCAECADWNAKLSKLCRQMEKIKIEAASYVQLIHSKLKRTGKEGKSDLSSKLADQSSGLMGKLQIAEALRKETEEKCFQKVHTSKPKIRMKKFSVKDVVAAKDKLKPSPWTSELQQNISCSNSNYADASIPATELIDVKVEHKDLEKSTSYIEMGDDYVDDVEDQDIHSEQNFVSPTTEDHFQTNLSVQITSSRFKQQKYSKNPDTGKFKCSLCPKELASAPAAYFHYQTDHLKLRFQCKICDKVCTNKSNLLRHQRNAHMKLKFKCEICAREFSSKPSLTGHKQKCSFQEKIFNEDT